MCRYASTPHGRSWAIPLSFLKHGVVKYSITIIISLFQNPNQFLFIYFSSTHRVSSSRIWAETESSISSATCKQSKIQFHDQLRHDKTAMSVMNSRDRVKQEGESTRSQWSSSHKNPRIVRVSRSFGGKDRHSKVCTVRGLRDRRIRLSVPTAVQLYDLQEKLGLSQPSKVVDWLLDATKNDIDNLPPLPIIPGLGEIFTQIPNPNQLHSPPNPPHQSSLSQFLASNTKIDEERGERDKEKEKWINEQENSHEGFGGFVAQNFFPLANVNQSHFPNYFHNWEHPNLSLSQFGPNYHPLANQGEDQNSHLYFCPTAPTIPPFPSYLSPPSMENLGFSTALQLMSSPMRPFALNLSSKSTHPHHNDGGRSEKED